MTVKELDLVDMAQEEQAGKERIVHAPGTLFDSNVIAQVVFSLSERSIAATGSIEFADSLHALYFQRVPGPFYLQGSDFEAQIMLTFVGIRTGMARFHVTAVSAKKSVAGGGE